MGIDLFPTQRLIAKLVYNIQLVDEEKALLKKWRTGEPDFTTDVHLPAPGLCKEVVLVCGMRSTKTFMGSFLACYETYKYLCLPDPWKTFGLSRGAPVFGMVAATSKDLARDTVFAQLKPLIIGVDFFENCGFEPLKTSFFFPSHNFTIRVGASSSAALVGRTDLFVVLDELDQCPDNKGRMGGEGVYRALSKGTATLNGLTVSLTSPLYEESMSMQLLNSAPDIPSTLGLRLPTWQMNHNLPRSHPKIRSAFKLDPEGASRDFGALPSAAISPFFRDRKKLFAAFTGTNLIDEDGCFPDRVEPTAGIYCIAGDPSVKNDAFGIAMAHRTGDKYIVDLAMALEPIPGQGIEVDPDTVLEVYDFLSRNFPVDTAIFDTYQYPTMMKKLRKSGIDVVQNHTLKTEYDNLKALIYSSAVVLPESALLRKELSSLELRNGKRVDHPSKGKKDIADAVCQCIFWLANQDDTTSADDALPFLI